MWNNVSMNEPIYIYNIHIYQDTQTEKMIEVESNQNRYTIRNCKKNRNLKAIGTEILFFVCLFRSHAIWIGAYFVYLFSFYCIFDKYFFLLFFGRILSHSLCESCHLNPIRLQKHWIGCMWMRSKQYRKQNKQK